MSQCLRCELLYQVAKAAAEGAQEAVSGGYLPKGEFGYQKGRYELARRILQSFGDDPGPLKTGKQSLLERILRL